MEYAVVIELTSEDTVYKFIIDGEIEYDISAYPEEAKLDAHKRNIERLSREGIWNKNTFIPAKYIKSITLLTE